MKTSKKIISFVITLAVSLSFFTVSAFAATNATITSGLIDLNPAMFVSSVTINLPSPILNPVPITPVIGVGNSTTTCGLFGITWKDVLGALLPSPGNGPGPGFPGYGGGGGGIGGFNPGIIFTQPW